MIYRAKVIFVGQSAVGKTSIVRQLCHGTFDESTLTSTVPGVFSKFEHRDTGERTIHVECWDTAGQERFRSLMPLYYRGASAAFIVYDVNDPASLREGERWFRELASKFSGQARVMIALVGNKIDLPRAVSLAAAKTLASRLGMDSRLCFECSARTGSGVRDFFRTAMTETHMRIASDATDVMSYSVGTLFPAKRVQSTFGAEPWQPDAQESQKSKARQIELSDQRVAEKPSAGAQCGC